MGKSLVTPGVHCFSPLLPCLWEGDAEFLLLPFLFRSSFGFQVAIGLSVGQVSPGTPHFGLKSQVRSNYVNQSAWYIISTLWGVTGLSVSAASV